MVSWLKAGNTAVITGGAQGIGLAAAQRYLDNDMNVLIADVDPEALETAKTSLKCAGGQLEAMVCDVGDLAQVSRLRDMALDTFGKVDCLMNNAGASVTRALPWEDVEGWKKQLKVNLWGIIHGCHAFIPDMLKNGAPAAVINTGSKQGITNPPGGFAYNLSKAGVVNYTQSVAYALRQVDQCQLSAHLLIPGFTYSNMIARFMPEKPAGAWTCEQVVDFLLQSVDQGDFYVICPDHDTPRELDNLRMKWNLDDLIQNRPALSRWHEDYADQYEAFVKGNR